MAVDPARVAQLFDSVIDLPATERASHLDVACAHDPTLRAEVDALLRADADADEFLTAPPALPRDPPPTRIGRYRDLEPIGEGGMGEVYAARDLLVGRKVAIKLLHDPELVGRDRLIREGVLLARIAHPNVVPLYDIGEHEDRVYLVMELIEGVSLRTWLKGQPQDWRVRLPPLLDAARGVAAAHALGLVHGDLKPDNLMVGDDGRTRVIDFGLARLADEGRLLGATPRYAPPEQFHAEPLTPASDQYSFCVTAYECLSGELPRRPQPQPLRDIPPRLDAALRRGLAPDPALRFDAMHDLIAEIAAALGRDPDTDLSIAAGARTAVFAALIVVAALIDVFVHVRGFGGPTPTADELVRLGVFSVAGVAVAVAVAWPRLRTRINRQFALLLAVSIAAMLVHRLLAARFDSPGAAVLAGDLMLLGALSTVAGLLLRAWLFGPALAFLAMSAAAALAPDHAAIAMSLGVWTAALSGVVALRAPTS